MAGWQGVQAAGPSARLCSFPRECRVSRGDPFQRASQLTNGYGQALPCTHKGPGRRWPPQDPQLCAGETGGPHQTGWKDVDF